MARFALVDERVGKVASLGEKPGHNGQDVLRHCVNDEEKPCWIAS